MPKCAECSNEATAAVRTQRPTRSNLWTKVWWTETEAPKEAERLCGEHVGKLITELARVLA